MKDIVTPDIVTNINRSFINQLYSGRIWRFVALVLLLTSLVACAGTPVKSTSSTSAIPSVPGKGLAGANTMYNTRNYTGAVSEFDTIITDADASANSRRLSHLGKALIYLSSDKNWHDIENAQTSLSAAGSIVPANNEEFSIETDMFMDSIAALINSEADYTELKTNSGGSKAEVSRLQKQNAELVAERDKLLKEQKILNQAIEKLKNLTLGN